jgi:hypothetical protein
MNELDDYLADGIYTSSVGQYMVGVGEKPGRNQSTFDDIGLDDITLHGLLFVWPDYWSNYENQWDDFDHSSPGKLDLLHSLADANDVPLLWISEADSNWRENEGVVEVGEVSGQDGGYSVRTDQVLTSEFADYLQDVFGTDLKPTETGKEAEKTIPLQAWGRENLPGDYITLDLDVVVTDSNRRVRGVGEIKRTYQSIASWSPYKFPDKLNYYLQAEICSGLDATPFIVKHQKNPVIDDNHVKYYEYHCDPTTSEWIDIDVEEKLTGAELRERLEQIKDD